MTDTELLDQIKKKYDALGESHLPYLKGLLHATPINYWDYVEVDTLLSLQKPRTGFKDEAIFIMYHQVTELMLKMMLHEIKQLVNEPTFSADFIIDKLNRMNEYTSMLINSFGIMKKGMNYEDYNTFRHTLTPASGFQSAQFRFVELYCTRLQNLISKEGREVLGANPSIAQYFEYIYWKAAGTNRETGEKTMTLRQFESKYLHQLTVLAHDLKGKTIEDKLLKVNNPSVELLEKAKEFDRLYNIDWPMVHLQTAQHYLDKKGENKQATGGSEWKKYLHPRYQQRRFFPSLWSVNEIHNWGKPNS
jgi:tryptophan 2,3-dioxygenase